MIHHSDTGDVQAFYRLLGNNTAWTGDSCRTRLEQLAGYMRQAPLLGLDNQYYDTALIGDALRRSSMKPDTMLDKKITKTALYFFSDVAYGQAAVPHVGYNGTSYHPEKTGYVIQLLANSILEHQFDSLLEILEPADTVYRQFKNQIAVLHEQISDSGFSEQRLPRFLSDLSDKGLLTRLQQLGISDTSTDIRTKIRQAEKMFSLMADGALRPNVTDALNIPLKTRLQQLNRGINCYRWLWRAQRLLPCVTVNIPSNTLFLYHHDSCLLHSRVIVGKATTPTPTLCSHISAIVLFPYWNVPRKIAVYELLPRIKANPAYLAANQFEVLNKSGHIVAPERINWADMTAANFPYTLRQNTGCDNSMGVIKLDFDSPYGVFLHDTPLKGLFMLKQRFFSHGCVRVEAADTLANLLAGDKAMQVAQLLQAGPANGQQPVRISLREAPLVFIVYNIAWPDEQGQLRFFSNPYHR